MMIFVTVDNITGEIIPYLIDIVMQKGAKNVHVISAITKKGRPEYIFLVDVEEQFFEDVISFLIAELGTIGYRILQDTHKHLDYEIIEQDVRILIEEIEENKKMRIKKIKNKNGKTITVNVEYEDLKNLANYLQSKGIHIPISKLKSKIETSFLSGSQIIIKKEK